MESLSIQFVRKHQTKRGLVFVLMPFSGELKTVYEIVLKPFIEGLGMQCLRADEIYSAKTVMQDIWENIQRAEIVLADLTDRNPNVMYELGLCHTLWKKIILITQKPDDVPFDLKGWRLIIYEPSLGGAERLKDGLRQTIEALRGEPTKEGQIIAYDQPEIGGQLPRAEATIEAIAKEYLTLQLKNGKMAQMSNEDVSWTNRVNDLTQRFKVGDKIDGVLLSVTTTPIIFSIRHKWPDPWPSFKKEFPVGTNCVGKVVRVNNYGVFVEIKKFFNGLIPRRTLSHGVSFQEGQELEATIKEIDPSRKNILLEYRGQTKNSWDGKLQKYTVGGNYIGKVLVVKESYLLVELEPGLQCIAHISNFPKDLGVKLREKFPQGSETRWTIKSVDRGKRQIQLAPMV